MNEESTDQPIGGRFRSKIVQPHMGVKVLAAGAGYFCLFLVIAASLISPLGEYLGPGDDEPLNLNETDSTPTSNGSSSPTEEMKVMNRSEQVSLGADEEVFVANGDLQQIAWVGDRYAIIFSRGGWSENSSLFVTYSEDCVNWSEPFELARGNEWGVKGSLASTSNGTLILVYGKATDSGDFRLFSSTSEDGLTWSAPAMLPNGSIRILDLYGVHLVQERGGILTIGFSGGLYDLESDVYADAMATMCLEDGKTWTGPQFAKTPSDHQYPNNYLYSLGLISLAERNGVLYVAHVDPAGDVWVGPRVDGRWDIYQANPSSHYSYFGGASMIHLGNGSTIVAFDHLKKTYLLRSNDTMNWDTPLLMTLGQMPAIASVSNSTLLVAYNGGGGIYIRLAGGPTETGIEESGTFEVSFPDEISDLYSEGTFLLVHNSSKKSSSIEGWDEERHDFLVFDSTEGRFELFGESREGWIPRVHKYTQSSGEMVWKLGLKYGGLDSGEDVGYRLNVYAGGSFGSESTWQYSQIEDTWTVQFRDAQCEEWDLENEEFTYLGKISFNMTVRRVE